MASVASVGAIVVSGDFADFVLTLSVLVIGYFIFCPTLLGHFFVQRWQCDDSRWQAASQLSPRVDSTLPVDDLCKEVDGMSGVASGTPKTCEDTLILAYESTLADGSSLLEFDEQAPPPAEIFRVPQEEGPLFGRNLSKEHEEMELDEIGISSDCFDMWTNSSETMSSCGANDAVEAVSVDANHSLEVALASGSAKIASSALMIGARHCGALWAHDAVGRLSSVGLELDSVSAVELMHIFGSEHRADLAVDFWLEADEDLDEEEEELTTGTDLYGAVLAVCVQCSDFDSATRTTDSTSWRVPACDSGKRAMLVLVRWLARRQNFRQAWECYESVLGAGGNADLATHRAVLIACVRGNNMTQADTIFQDIITRGLQADGTCLSAMICGHCATGALDKALTHFSMMKKLRITPTASLFDAIINGCMWGTAPAVLEQVLVDMEADGVCPSNATIAALVRHYGRSGDVNRALTVFEEMPRRYGIHLDSRAYAALVSVSLTNDRLDLALEVAKMSYVAGFVPSARTYESLISSCLKHGDLDNAVSLFDDALCLKTEQGSTPACLEPKLLEDLLRLIGRRRQAARLGGPFIERLVAGGVEVPEVAASILRSSESGFEVDYRVLHERQAERQNWRDFSR